MNGTAPNSLRLARHTNIVKARFETILNTCRKGVTLSVADRNRLGLKKQCVVPLHPDKPSHTLTTLPDDFLHYSEPRILTVREYARLQSFPDWYEFKGNYTTGGNRRLRECPRYTQAGNAVPPLLGEFLGRMIVELALELGLLFRTQPSVHEVLG
jgi:DNA (cytosine-5)-methyltransferase 1